MGLSKEEIKEKVLDVLESTTKIEKKHIELDSKLVDDLGLDSFDAINLVFDIENAFEIEVPDSDVQLLKSVNDIVAYVSSKQ